MFDQLGETITIRRVTHTDAKGDKTTAEVTLDGALFDIQSSAEDRDRRDATVSTARVFVPFGSDVRPGDVLIRASGSRWHVDGEPFQHEHTWNLGMEVPARRTRG